MAWYKTGTVAVAATKVTGTGTNFLDAKFGIGPGQAFLIPGSGTVKIFEIASVEDATHLTLTTTAGTVAAGTAYAVMSFYTDSVPDFSKRLAAQLGYYQSQMDGWQQIMTGSGLVSVTAPDGTVVNISSFAKLTSDIAKAYVNGGNLGTTIFPNNLGNTADFNIYYQTANTNAVIANGYPIAKAGTLFVTQSAYGCQQMYITFQGEAFVRGLTGTFNPAAPNWSDWWPIFTGKSTIPIANGGTGAKSASAARDSLGLTTGTSVGNVSVVHAGIRNSANLPQKTWDAIYEPFQSGNVFPESCVIQMIPGPTDREWGELGICYGSSNRAFIAKASYSSSLPTGNIVVMELKHDKNTTIDSNGFLKAASPIIEIFSDGKFKTNDEAEGAVVLKVGVGQYLITGITGTNSDAAWGGVDGGFEIPKDKNGLNLIWLDYEVNADGSMLIKTYHRTHRDSPSFAQNEIEGFENGDPIDLPKGRFVSVRVEMAEDSIFNTRFSDAAQAVDAISKGGTS